jgi:FkbH-like protein
MVPKVPEKTNVSSKAISARLRDKRQETAQAFANAFLEMPKWTERADKARNQWQGFLETEFYAFVDYLAEYFAKGDDNYRHLLIGEKIKAFYDPSSTDDVREAQRRGVHARELQEFETLHRQHLNDAEWNALKAGLLDIHSILEKQAAKTQRVLMVGDCVFIDIVSFAYGPLMDTGVGLETEYETSKNPVELRHQIRKRLGQKFDMVFYSPLTYDFNSEYARLSNWRSALAGTAGIDAAVQSVWKEIEVTLDLLADVFDCPIHVHNSAHLVRDPSRMKRRLKMLVTSRARARSRNQINARLAQYAKKRNAETFKHIYVLDEKSIVQEHGELEAGGFYYHAPLQHPSVYGKLVARHYTDLIYVNAFLAKKKLVVCDLDNTLWDGVIGEGEVAHFHDRQTVLKELKKKGVVLAINSKNDPQNIHWKEGTLNDDDFVFANINWEPKVNGMQKMQRELNMKMKDFIFVDDRQDERELVNAVYPEILCMDATDTGTWKKFAMWLDLLEDDPDMDRTLMYKQRELRKAFVQEDPVSDLEKASLFATLDLQLTIEQASKQDLKRIAELINRTNQFNLAGFRTSVKEVTDWHAAAEYLILVGQTADRFGSMGTTCVVIARLSVDALEIVAFVLSCRVFGYGIERGMMNHLKQLAAARGKSKLIGRYDPTPHNAPCKDFLPENGFKPDGAAWRFDMGDASPANASWLTIVVKS